MSSDGTRVIIGAIFNDAGSYLDMRGSLSWLLVVVLQHPSGFSSEKLTEMQLMINLAGHCHVLGRSSLLGNDANAVTLDMRGFAGCWW
jgi:hypothetical protein